MHTPLLTIVGNRPQFIKMAPISKEFKKRGYKEFIIHTGQHYDHNLSEVFFNEMEIPTPDVSLKITSKNHGKMTAEILEQLETIFLDKKPRGVLIFGDTNSTLAAALAAVKLKIWIAHVEAGPRIYDMDTPEEINRIVADRSAKLLFCPDVASVQNLAKESITEGAYFTGDVMYDSYLLFSNLSQQKSRIFNELKLEKNNYILITIHRPNNTDTKSALSNLISLCANMNETVVFPVHPRTESALKKYNLWQKLSSLPNVKLIPAVGYLDLLSLLNSCKLVLTDSGGLQKEAYFAKKMAFVLFHTTPWPEIKKLGWQKVVGGLDSTNIELLKAEVQNATLPHIRNELFGDGNAAAKIVDILEQQHWLTADDAQ